MTGREGVGGAFTGASGGGGVRTGLRQRLSTQSCLIPRDAVRAGYAMLD